MTKARETDSQMEIPCSAPKTYMFRLSTRINIFFCVSASPKSGPMWGAESWQSQCL